MILMRSKNIIIISAIDAPSLSPFSPPTYISIYISYWCLQNVQNITWIWILKRVNVWQHYRNNLLKATIFVVITIQTVKITHSSSNISTVTCPLQLPHPPKKQRVKKTAHLRTSSLLTIEAFVDTNKFTATFTKAATAYMINHAITIASNLCIDLSCNFKVYIC